MVLNLQNVSSFVIGAILITGALTKLLNFRWFVGVLKKYDLTPPAVVNLVGLGIAFLELAAGIMLVLRRWLPWSAYGAWGLFLIFTGAVIVSIVRGKFDIECGCNNPRKKTRVGWGLVFRNVGLMGLALLSSASAIRYLERVYPWIFLASMTMVLVPFLPRRRCH